MINLTRDWPQVNLQVGFYNCDTNYLLSFHWCGSMINLTRDSSLTPSQVLKLW